MKNSPKQKFTAPIRDIAAALDFVLRFLASDRSGIEEIRNLGDITAVGHRVVHGGELFKESVLIDDKVVAGIEECIDLAPLHNPNNLRGIRAVRELFGERTPQVAVFDTAFHPPFPSTPTCTRCPTICTGVIGSGGMGSMALRTATWPTATACCRG